jgi:hypothetical protein
MSLLALQREFGAWLRDGDADEASAGMTAYQNNYRGSLTACIEESFARTREWIGDEAFRDAMIHHIQRVPPSSWTLDAYGRDFPDTLMSLYPDDPEVAELAGIEWALGEAFVAPDASVVVPAEAVNADWDRAMLHLTPTLDHREIGTNAPAIWAALAAGEMPPPAEILPERGAVIVWREGFISRFRAVDQNELHALLLARSGLSFAALCEALVASLGDDQGIALAGSCLGQWLGDGLVCRITYPAP